MNIDSKLTLKEACELLGIDQIKVLSGYNGKVLAKRFNPKKHATLGERKVIKIWSEFESSKYFKSVATTILVCFVDGGNEYKKSHCSKEVKEWNIS